MKSFPILTVIVIMGFGGLKLASAWQEAPAASIEEQKGSDPSPEAAPHENPEAVALIHESKERLFKARSLRAKVVQKASLGVYQFSSEGTYVSASDLKFRYEYTAKLGKMEGQFLEVSDGQVIHTRKQIGKAATSAAGLSEIPQTELSRRDLQTILRARQQNQDLPNVVQAADAGIGGLPAVLASLEQNLIFDALKKDTLDNRPVTVVRGIWRQDRRDSLLTSLGPMAAQFGPLVPDQIRIVIDDETMIPKQFLYLKLASEERKSYRPILTVDLMDVQLGTQVADQIFNYTPPAGMQERDDTEIFLQMISGAAAVPAESAQSPSAQQ